RSCTSNLTVGMLCHTQSSIKEIVNELKFPNLSFFGKYFKAHKGMSPKYYRTAYLNTQLSSL
ncbi:helix-turn-helix domain-containing protein, partial [Bacteroides gallinaceum]